MNARLIPAAQHFAPVNAAGIVTAVGLNDDTYQNLKLKLGADLGWEVLASEQLLVRQVEQGILQGDVVLIGAGVEAPVQMAQQVHSFDKTIPVLILAKPQQCDELRRSIMFAPLLGSVVTPWELEDIEGLAQALVNAVERHRQRRHYLDTIISVQPKIGNLSLSQPELGHYLGRLLDQAPVGVISLDAQGCILGLNKQADRILGISERDALGMALADYFNEASQYQLANLLMRSAVGEKFGMNPEILQSVPKGLKQRFFEATASRIAYRADQRGYMVILQDVTERERAEQQRRKAEQHMRQLSSALEQTADAVMITDGKRVIEYVNPAFEALTGYSKDEAIGKKTYFLRSGVHDKKFYRQLLKTISSGEVFRGVLVNRRKDGSIYHEEKTITPLRDSEGNITQFISTGHDITERLNAEEAIRHHQADLAHVARLNTLGEMTSGIAHELNQPLCAIITYAQTCMRIVQGETYSEGKLNYGLENVVKQAELAGAIFARLRDFARKRELPRQRIDMNEIIREVLNLVSAELTQKRITIDVDRQGGNFFVLADPIQIEQVLLNLVRNSMDAIVDLSASRKRLKLTLSSSDSKQVKVSLIDRGLGCSEEVVARLFEPFFTTKENGLGVGLGISQSIIEAHGGRIFLESSGKKGTKFSFTMPKAETEIEQASMPEKR